MDDLFYTNAEKPFSYNSPFVKYFTNGILSKHAIDTLDFWETRQSRLSKYVLKDTNLFSFNGGIQTLPRVWMELWL